MTTNLRNERIKSTRRLTDPTEGFGDRLRIAHDALEVEIGHKVSQQEVADGVARHAGETVDQTTVSRWFTGTLPRTAGLGWAVCQFYGCNAGWLYFNEGQMRTVRRRATG